APFIGAQKRVLLGLPVYDKPEVEMVTSLFDMTVTTKHACRVWFQSGSLVHRARSIMAAKALEADWDYILFIDGDMKFPADALDRLLKHNVDVVGALCTMRQPPFLPTMAKFTHDDQGRVTGAATILNYPDNDLF